MDELSEYDLYLTKQERHLLAKTPRSPSPTLQLSDSHAQTPRTKDRKKNLDYLFERHSDPYVVSKFCSVLNQHLPEGSDPKASMKAIMSTIQAMSEEGELPKDKYMEEVSTKRQIIVAIEETYT